MALALSSHSAPCEKSRTCCPAFRLYGFGDFAEGWANLRMFAPGEAGCASGGMVFGGFPQDCGLAISGMSLSCDYRVQAGPVVRSFLSGDSGAGIQPPAKTGRKPASIRI